MSHPDPKQAGGTSKPATTGGSIGTVEDSHLQSIREYAAQLRAAQDARMQIEPNAAERAEFEACLDQTLEELQMRVREQQEALEKLRASTSASLPTAPSPDPQTRLKQLRTIKAAYERLAPSEPPLPRRGSLLPALLAARTIQRTIFETKDAIATTQDRLARTTAQLRREEAELGDANLITAALEARVEQLRAARLEEAQKSASQAARELLEARQARKREYDGETQRLRAALDSFVRSRLAGMIAAEELGGPVVGSLMDVDDEMLGGGFSQQGKPKKSSRRASAEPADARQRRIDEVWGRAVARDDEPLTEKDAAATEALELVEQLLGALLGEGGSGAYVQLERDSAAARFLVRAKVAQFHPKDARRLRLVDFGRELDD